LEVSLLNQLHEYWNRRASTYNIPDVFGRRIIGAFVKKLKPKSLVEVGCGAGELFPCYKNVSRVVGLDWSKNMLNRSYARIDRHGYTNIELKQMDITKEWVSERFDLALTRTVLMHIPPDTVAKAAENMTEMSDSLLVMEYFNPDPEATKRLAPHNWHHSYPTIFENLGYHVEETYDRPDGLPQILFHFVKEVKK